MREIHPDVETQKTDGLANCFTRQMAALEEGLKALKVRVAALEDCQKSAFQEPQECQERRCSFHTHYLSLGPPELTHEGYHAAEAKCATYQGRCMAWHEEHPDKDDRHCPWCHLADEWEQRIRA